MAARIGDREPVEGVIGDPRHHRIVGGTIDEANDPGGKRKQIEQPEHREQREQAKNIGLRLRTPDRHQRDRDRDQPARDQKHEQDAARAPRRLVCGHKVPGQVMVALEGHAADGPTGVKGARILISRSL